MFYETLSKMKATLGLTVYLFGLSVIGFNSLPSAVAKDNLPAASLMSDTKNSGQMLPVTATAIMGGQKIELEVAKTPKQKMLGLMYREFLPANRGMLFSFDPPQDTRFWMKNVSIPLDMIFLRADRIVAIAVNVPPCNSTPCPTYGPQAKIDRVIELPGGRAIELGLKPGDLISIEYLDNL